MCHYSDSLLFSPGTIVNIHLLRFQYLSHFLVPYIIYDVIHFVLQRHQKVLPAGEISECNVKEGVMTFRLSLEKLSKSHKVRYR